MSTATDVFDRLEPSRVIARGALAHYCDALAAELRVVASGLAGEPVCSWHYTGGADGDVVLVAESGNRHHLVQLEHDDASTNAAQFVRDTVFLHQRSTSLLALTRTERDDA